MSAKLVACILPLAHACWFSEPAYTRGCVLFDGKEIVAIEPMGVRRARKTDKGAEIKPKGLNIMIRGGGYFNLKYRDGLINDLFKCVKH